MKIEGWESILADQIATARHTAFKWGAFDCCLWSANVVQAITGRDPMASFRGRYRTESGARKLIAKLGQSLDEHISTLFQPIPVPKAQRGDLVFKYGAVGVCAGMESYFVTPSGLNGIKTLSCEQAWRVE